MLDIDGVLADVRHRLHHLSRKPKDWDAFFAAASADRPLPAGAELAHTLASDHPLVYLTGRPSRLRHTTETWLQRHGLPGGRLLMRRSGDFRPAREVKLELVRRLEAPVHVVVDDDPAVVQAMRDAGYAVLHATWAAPEPVLHRTQEQDGHT